MSQRLDTSAAQIWLDAEGILHCVGKPGVRTCLPEAQEILRAFDLASAGTKRPVLVDLSHVGSMDRAARAHMASAECASIVSAAGLVVGSPLARAIGSFFVGLNKPIMPTRLFDNEASAMAWLMELL